MYAVKNILFDLDGIIVDSMPLHAQAWKKTFSAIGISLDDVDIYRREGMSGPASIRDIFLEKNLVPPDEKQLLEIIDAKHSFFRKDDIRLFREIDDIISFLDCKGIRMGLVTGSHRVTVHEIVPERILAAMSVIITSDDVIYGKPDPQSYLLALERAAMEPSATLVVENAPMGIRAAKKAGLVCLAVETTLPAEFLYEADLVFPDHEALKRHFIQSL